MKLKKTTWILVIIAALFGGFVYFYEIQGKPQREELQAKQKQIFNFKEEDIKILTIDTQGKTLKFERTGDENIPWRMKQPEDTLASNAAVSFLTNLLVEAKGDRNFTSPAERSQEYGFNPPVATITVQLVNQETHKIVLGKPEFKDEFIYSQIDPPAQGEKELKITLIPKELSYAVEREYGEWKQPEEKPKNPEEKKQPSPKTVQ
jgi:hypothetical protein